MNTDIQYLGEQVKLAEELINETLLHHVNARKIEKSVKNYVRQVPVIQLYLDTVDDQEKK